MKKLVWLLFLVNLVLLGYFNLDILLPSVPHQAMAAIEPEKISILSAQQIASLPRKSGGTVVQTSNVASPTPTTDASIGNPTATTSPSFLANACYEWGVFSAANLTNAQSELAGLSIQAKVKEQNPLEAKRFWVFKKPLRSPEAAEAKALELKALGITELYIVQEAKWKNAISFGVFEDEQLATGLLNQLRAKGVKDVVKALRNQGGGHASLIFGKLSTTELVQIKNLKAKFPEADIKEASCS